MKKLYSLILFVTLAYTLQAQWVLQIPTNIAENRGVHMTSSTTGYVVGSDGIILKTTNAGALWDTVSSGTSDTLRSVFFCNDTIGYVCGANGTIRKTIDSGYTWTALSSNVPNLLRSIYFVNDSVGYACGGGGVILRTLDGGTTWNPQVSGTTQDLINIRFRDPDNGYCVSSLSTFTSGIILKTVDGGNNWTSVYTDAYGLLGLALADDSTIYAGGGYQLIVKSTDDGATWTTINPSNAALPYHFRSADFLSTDTGYVTGDSGKIYYTNDGGLTWTNQGYNINGVLSIYCYSADTIYACGAVGTILRYTKPCTPDAPSAINGGTTACSGDTGVFYISPVPNATSYTWQIPAGATILSGQGDTLITVLFGVASGNIVVAASNICGQGPATNQLITVLTTPPVPVITQVSGILLSTSLVGNQWYLNGVAIPGATNATWLPVQNGTYTVIVTYTNGCSATSAPFNVTNASIDDFEVQYQAKAQPNPFYDQLNLYYNLNKVADVSFTVSNITGAELLSETAGRKSPGNQKISLNTLSWPQGVYFIKLKINDDTGYIKIVKQ